MKIRKNDNVQVIAGKDKGKKGKVRHVYPSKDRVLVEGANMVKKAARATRQARQAGLIELEAPLHVSNVMLVCSKCDKPSRVGYKELEDGRRVRVCRSCSEVID
jgi:large subunit ribosomal protein L24